MASLWPSASIERYGSELYSLSRKPVINADRLQTENPKVVSRQSYISPIEIFPLELKASVIILSIAFLMITICSPARLSSFQYSFFDHTFPNTDVSHPLMTPLISTPPMPYLATCFWLVSFNWDSESPLVKSWTCLNRFKTIVCRMVWTAPAPVAFSPSWSAYVKTMNCPSCMRSFQSRSRTSFAFFAFSLDCWPLFPM